MQTRYPAADRAGVFSLPLRVYYEDTDAAGVVYYANYLRFCERARTEWLRALGLEQQRLLAERDIAFVVSSLSADYLSPGLLDDALRVDTRIDRLGRASIVFGQTILRGEQRLFTAQVTVACVNWKRRKPAALPDELRIQLEKLLPA